MTLRNTHTLISAYAALATIAAGLLAYGAMRPERTEPAVGKLTIESVKAPGVERIASRLTPSDQPTSVQ